MAAILPTERHVQCEIEGPTAFATLRRPIDDAKPDARQDVFDQVIRAGRKPDLIERFENEPFAAIMAVALTPFRRACLALDLVKNVLPPRLPHCRFSFLARRYLLMASHSSALC